MKKLKLTTIVITVFLCALCFVVPVFAPATKLSKVTDARDKTIILINDWLGGTALLEHKNVPKWKLQSAINMETYAIQQIVAPVIWMENPNYYITKASSAVLGFQLAIGNAYQYYREHSLPYMPQPEYQHYIDLSNQIRTLLNDALALP